MHCAPPVHGRGVAARRRARRRTGTQRPGEHLEAFYACLHYAALRSSEAVMLRKDGTARAPDGRVFQTAWGGNIQDSAYGAV